MLSPGGMATYQLPYTKEDCFVMIKPGKKEVDHGSPFKDKADIAVSATNSIGDTLNQTCSKPASDSSSAASDYCSLPIESLVSDSMGILTVSISVPQEETREAAIWQIHIGPLDDSNR
jgi:hypothetical protein